MKKLSLLFLFTGSFLFSQKNDDKMNWFSDAKLGIFIHWGIYSVNGVSESWSFFNEYMPYADYRAQLNGFKAENYHPEEWATLIKNSGAKYAVITSRHHDGVSLWDTKAENSISIPKDAAARRDVLTPFVKELKKNGLKTGIYYSLPDWSHPDYDIFTKNTKRYDYKNNPQRFSKFIKYYQAQLREISQQYHPDLYWFDGDWEHSAQEWKAQQTRDLLLKGNPNAVINARLAGKGDYQTPEQGIPMQSPEAKYWELCYTMNDSWGFQQDDHNYKSPEQIIKTLVECISMGGNLLLDIGPKADGTIPNEQVNILKELGRWTAKHSEAIYGTRKGIPQMYFSGKSALSKDGKSLFLYVSDNQAGNIWLRGIQNEIAGIKLVGATTALKYNRENSDVWIDLPEKNIDPMVSVIRVDLKTPLILKEQIDVKITGTETASQQIKKLAYLLSIGVNPYAGENIGVNNPPKNTGNLEEVEKWTSKHAELFGQNIKKGLSESRYAGVSALSEDGQTLYLFADGKKGGNLMVKGITNEIQRIRIVGEGSLLTSKIYDKLYWSKVPGLISIELPEQRRDSNITVIAVLLDSPLKEYEGEVSAVESN